MILLFEIHSIGDGCLFWLLCLIKRITTNNRGSLYMEQRILTFFLFISPHHMGLLWVLWPEGRLGGFFKPTLQILTELLIAVGFCHHVKNDGFHFLGECGPFLGRETPVSNDGVLSSEDSVFLTHRIHFVHNIHEVGIVHGFL